MIAEDATAGGAGLPSSGDIRAVSGQIGAVQRQLHRDWLWIRLLVAVALALGIWTVVQQAAIDGKTADIARLEQQAAAKSAADARNARNLCVKLRSSRAVIVTAWQEVQFVPGADRQALLAKIKAAEPLGKCR